jgi:uncharacterized membrane protein
VRRGNDRYDGVVVHALDNELEQVPQVPTAHLRSGSLVTGVAPLELGDGFVNDSILGIGENC